MRLDRHTLTGVVAAAVLLLGTPGALHAADQARPPAEPSALAMTMPGTNTSVTQGSWINIGRVDIRFSVDASAGPVTPQVEIQPFSTPFTGKQNFSGATVSSSGTAVVAVSGLSNRQTYHWQARVVDASNNPSAWVPFSAAAAPAPDLGIDQNPPARPTIASATNPNQNQWYNSRTVILSWTSRDDLSGIQGYTFRLLHSPHVIAPGTIVGGTGLRLSNIGDGIWFLALRAVDRAGNWSPTATFKFQLDRHPPQLIWMSPNRINFNPYRGPISVRFRSDKDANVHINLYRVGDRVPTMQYSYPGLRAGQVVTISWHGKQRNGRTVPRGYYFFSAQATDRANNLARFNLGGIVVQPDAGQRAATGQILYPGDGKVIFVSLSRQTLYAYDGTRLALQTVVTTGNPSLPTPPGAYTVMAKYHPFEFISPWPAGSPYWYPPSWSQYAMLFRDGGYFLHDAPWRSTFGPGTNGPGQPGTNYGGTHGCVNIPPGPMIFLWDWAPIGTRVNVVP